MTPLLQTDAVMKWLDQVCPAGDLFSDSREIAQAEREAVFLAYPAGTADGRQYIAQAIKSGAKAVIYEESGFVWDPQWNVPHQAVAGLRDLAGFIADAYYGHPSADLFVAAITGTNGKTSCAQWIGCALSLLGKKSAVIGTLGVTIFEKGKAKAAGATGYTTPEQVQLQRRLAALVKEGVSCLAIEASSIGIEEGRLNGLAIDVALYTNLSRDHLDYHKDMASYQAAKRKLFDWPSLRQAVVNLDDAIGRTWAAKLQEKLPVFGYTAESIEKAHGIPVLQALEIQSRREGTSFVVTGLDGHARVQTRLVGRFNVSNVLGVLGVLLAYGAGWKTSVSVLPELLPPPGRMQALGGQAAPLVVIDYAHTPDALEKGLDTLRTVAQDRKGDLWCVFGCGGDRDRGKREEMGQIAEKADHVIVTSDNPRNETPMDIIGEIVSGMTRLPQIIEDRASAILQAVKQASADDVIFLAGKGHETYQEIGGVRHPFVDAEHAALALGAFNAMKRGIK